MSRIAQVTTPDGAAYVDLDDVVLIGSETTPVGEIQFESVQEGAGFRISRTTPIEPITRFVGLRGGHGLRVLDTPENMTKLLGWGIK